MGQDNDPMWRVVAAEAMARRLSELARIAGKPLGEFLRECEAPSDMTVGQYTRQVCRTEK